MSSGGRAGERTLAVVLSPPEYVVVIESYRVFKYIIVIFIKRVINIISSDYSFLIMVT